MVRNISAQIVLVFISGLSVLGCSEESEQPAQPISSSSGAGTPRLNPSSPGVKEPERQQLLTANRIDRVMRLDPAAREAELVALSGGSAERLTMLKRAAVAADNAQAQWDAHKNEGDRGGLEVEDKKRDAHRTELMNAYNLARREAQTVGLSADELRTLSEMDRAADEQEQAARNDWVALDWATQHFLQHWGKCGERYVSVVGDTEFTEVTNPRPYFATNERTVMGELIQTPLTEADRLNGVTFKKVVFFKFGALRRYRLGQPAWSEWESVSGLRWPLEISVKNGMYEATRWGMDIYGEKMDVRKFVLCEDVGDPNGLPTPRYPPTPIPKAKGRVLIINDLPLPWSEQATARIGAVAQALASTGMVLVGNVPTTDDPSKALPDAAQSVELVAAARNALGQLPLDSPDAARRFKAWLGERAGDINALVWIAPGPDQQSRPRVYAFVPETGENAGVATAVRAALERAGGRKSE